MELRAVAAGVFSRLRSRIGDGRSLAHNRVGVFAIALAMLAPAATSRLTDNLDETGDSTTETFRLAVVDSRAAPADGSAMSDARVSALHAPPADHPEGMLVRGLRALRLGRSAEAASELERAVQSAPNFRAAQLAYGDALMARSGRLPLRPQNGSPNLQGLEQEIVARTAHYTQHGHLGQVPSAILALAPSQHHVIAVDVGESRVYVFRNEGGEARYVTDFYATMGRDGAVKSEEGDARTPVGVYRVVSSISPRQLAPFYGSGAFPLSYPNEWDRIAGRQGHGIWLHGSPPDAYSRPPRSSSGCVVLTNSDLDTLARFLDIGNTPVVIAEKLEWVAPAQARGERARVVAALAGWRGPILANAGTLTRTSYERDTVASDATGDTRRADDDILLPVPRSTDDPGLGLFRYPGADNIVLVTFDREIVDGEGRHTVNVRQYWSRENETWKIVYESRS